MIPLAALVATCCGQRPYRAFAPVRWLLVGSGELADNDALAGADGGMVPAQLGDLVVVRRRDDRVPAADLLGLGQGPSVATKSPSVPDKISPGSLNTSLRRAPRWSEPWPVAVMRSPQGM